MLVAGAITAANFLSVGCGGSNIPATPSALQATAVGPSEIDLNWADNSNNENGFKIERKIGVNGIYAQAATVEINVNIYQDKGLTSGTTYYYRVYAYNFTGGSGYSNEETAITPNAITQAAYFNSFESEKDIKDWVGIWDENIVSEPAPDPCGGNYVVIVSGGCIQPAASLTFSPSITGTVYVFSVWGRKPADSQGGGISLGCWQDHNAGNSIGIAIDSNEWKLYQAEETLNCPVETANLKFEIHAGGFISSPIYIDCLTVGKVY